MRSLDRRSTHRAHCRTGDSPRELPPYERVIADHFLHILEELVYSYLRSNKIVKHILYYIKYFPIRSISLYQNIITVQITQNNYTALTFAMKILVCMKTCMKIRVWVLVNLLNFIVSLCRYFAIQNFNLRIPLAHIAQHILQNLKKILVLIIPPDIKMLSLDFAKIICIFSYKKSK